MEKKLNFGCGTDIREGWDNCDIQEEAPISFDFDKFPYPLKDNYYDYVWIHGILENLLYPERVLYELRKKCKNYAIIEAICPYWNASWIYHDLKSRRGFNKQGFICFCNVRDYEINRVSKFDLVEINYLPSAFGKYIYPIWFREKLSVIFGGIISGVHVKLRVINKKIEDNQMAIVNPS